MTANMSANMQQTTMIGRFSRDPVLCKNEAGDDVCVFVIVVNNPSTLPDGTQKNVPVYFEWEAYNRKRNFADMVYRQRKGTHIYLQGHTRVKSMLSKDGANKYTKNVLVVDNLEFLEAPSVAVKEGMRVPARR